MSASLQYNQMPTNDQRPPQMPYANSGFNQPILMGDAIKNLPMNKNPPTPNEIHLINSIFANTNKPNLHKIIKEGKDILVLGILFIILSLPQIDEIIKKIFSNNHKFYLYSFDFKSITINGIMVGN